MINHNLKNPLKDCICYNCRTHRRALMLGRLYDCSCESTPEYIKEMCDQCRYNNKCDVALHPEVYNWEGDMPNEIRCTWGEVERAYMYFYSVCKPIGMTHCEALQKMCVDHTWEIVENWLQSNARTMETFVSVFKSDIDEKIRVQIDAQKNLDSRNDR